MTNKTVLFDKSSGELEQFVGGIGAPKFRAKQISEWLCRGAPDFSVMKNLPENFRRDLDKIATTLPTEIESKLDSSDGQTTKFLLRLADGLRIETVLMRTSYGNSVCVSSQAGCAMGCRFCASTLLGIQRNLSMNEMIAQVLTAAWELRKGEDKSSKCKVQSSNKDNFELTTNNSSLLSTLRSSNSIKPNGDPNNNDVSHIVVMGTGEPLQNMENLFGFLEYANSNLGISWRRITVSTCGIVPGIIELTEWGRPINLAISLHAPNDELRSKLMPINNKYKIADVLDAAFKHTDKTGRQLMIEYMLLGDVNDSAELAEQLTNLLRGKNCMVNLIPWNAVAERDFRIPSGNAIHKFQDTLIKRGIHTRIRRERGADIGSACGQLRLGN